MKNPNLSFGKPYPTRGKIYEKINDIFIGRNLCLPNNFLIPNYDTFCSLILGLEWSQSFLNIFLTCQIQVALINKLMFLNCDFNIIVENWTLKHDNLLKYIKRIIGYVDINDDNGIIMADTDLNWVAVQDIPINWGVLHFKVQKKNL